MCPRDKLKEESTARDLNLDLFYKIIDQLQQYDFPRYYLLVGLGEPLLNNNFFKMVEYINRVEDKVDIVLHTNSTLLTKEMIDKLLYSRLTEINFSINTGSEESYKSLTNQSSYVDTKKKIISFLNRKNELKIKKRVFLQYIENDHSSFDEFKKEWGPYQDDEVKVYYKHLVNFGGEVNIDNIYSRVQKSSNSRRPCYWLWRNIHIDCDGYVYPCCQGNIYRKSSSICLGNVSEGIKKILDSEKLEDFKQLHLEEKWDKIDECKNCNHWDAKPWFFEKTAGTWRVAK